MEGILLLSGATCALVSLGFLEFFFHRRNLSRIPIRIHVNGTRGKSSVTRLIAAGLRAGGVRTCAKTTGTLPQLILPDGSEEPVVRPAKANIIEQLAIVRRSVEEQADAIVIECMALNPLLQSLCEFKIIRSTHGVITNARPDHLDVMGPTPADVARALAGTVPVGGTMFTAERQQADILHEAARDRGSRMVGLTDDDVAAITPEELNGFSYVEHPDNVALALSVCIELGIDRGTALSGMQNVVPDPGAMTACELSAQGRRFRFVNGFAANDPLSTEQNWELASSQMPFADTRIALINCRRDRPERSLQLAEMCLRRSDVDHCLLIGSGTEAFARRALALGMKAAQIANLAGRQADEICAEVLAMPGPSCFVMGMGNIAGVGMDVINCFSGQSLPATELHPTTVLQEAA